MKNEVIVWTTNSDDITAINEGITTLSDAGNKSLFLLVCSNNNYNEDALFEQIKQSPVDIYGGIFPGLIYKGAQLKKGAIMIGFSVPLDTYLYQDLSAPKLNLDHLISTSSTPIEQQENLVLLLDGLSNSTENFVNKLYEYIGSDINIIGGGAGHDNFEHAPCIITKFGILQNSALLIALPFNLNKAIGTGWKVLTGPFLVTETQENTIFSINYQPAYDVFINEIKAQFPDYNTEDFNSLASQHPIGIIDLQDNIITRDPIATGNGELQLVGRVYTNSMIHILKGSADDLIESYVNAFRASAGVPLEKNMSLVFNCVSRKQYLKERFDDELTRIHQSCSASHQMIGMLTLGEICDSPNGAIQWLNKSVVIGSF